MLDDPTVSLLDLIKEPLHLHSMAGVPALAPPLLARVLGMSARLWLGWWLPTCPSLLAGVPIEPVLPCQFPCYWQELHGPFPAQIFFGKTLTGTSIPCSFSLGKDWGLSVPAGRVLPVMADTRLLGIRGQQGPGNPPLGRMPFWRQPGHGTLEGFGNVYNLASWVPRCRVWWAALRLGCLYQPESALQAQTLFPASPGETKHSWGDPLHPSTLEEARGWVTPIHMLLSDHSMLEGVLVFCFLIHVFLKMFSRL